jgi:hypothetical protein
MTELRERALAAIDEAADQSKHGPDYGDSLLNALNSQPLRIDIR